jgi:aminoglycoside 6'-N-acetyltransferase I
LQRLEAHARSEGILTLFLGSDDDYGGTTLFGRDLFPDVLSHVATIEATARGHALAFYRRHGYRVVGVLPDVNGLGRPDILLAKRIASRLYRAGSLTNATFDSPPFEASASISAT